MRCGHGESFHIIAPLGLSSIIMDFVWLIISHATEIAREFLLM
jgi:hypothetical protein